MKIYYDVAELQQYLNPQGIDPSSFQRIFPMGVPFDPRSIQSIFPTNVQRGITASSAAIPFGTPVDIEQGFTRNTPSDQGTNFQFLPSANEADETDEVIDRRSGIAKLLEFLQRFSPIANIARGISSLRNRADVRKAIEKNIRSDPQGGPTITFRNVKQQAQDRIDDRGRGQIPSRTISAPKKSSSNVYSEAKRSFFRD